MIISTGGGMPVREENRALMRGLGKVVYLTAAPKTLYGRLCGDDKRPLLKSGELMEKIVTMLSERDPLYRAAADEICVTDGKSVDEVAALIN
jgi:shikimate kinase